MRLDAATGTELGDRDADQDDDRAAHRDRAEPLAVGVARDRSEDGLHEQDERSAARSDVLLPPELQRQRERRARDAGERDREDREPGEMTDPFNRGTGHAQHDDHDHLHRGVRNRMDPLRVLTLEHDPDGEQHRARERPDLARADRQINESIQPLRRAPGMFTESRPIHVGVDADGQIQGTTQPAQQVRAGPPGFRRRKDPPIGRRIKLQVERTKSRDANSRESTELALPFLLFFLADAERLE